MQQIAVIDYGMGNLRSVSKALEFVAKDHAEILVTSDPRVIANADRVVFPGQGAAKACMLAIEQTHLNASIRQAAAEKPFLGICMGLQVLFSHSEENQGVNLLGLIPGSVKHFAFPADSPLKVPHMGWNHINQTQDHPLWHGISNPGYFYFVHSYYVTPDDSSLIAGTTDYGLTYCSAIAHNNIFALQAHPEKSADLGLHLFKNFLIWKP